MENYLNFTKQKQSNQIKFEKNPGYKNINTSQFNKSLVVKNTSTLSSCVVT